MVSAPYAKLMRQLPLASSEADVKKLIEIHLKAKGGFAGDYAQMIWSVISTTGGRENAIKIADDTKLQVLKISHN